MERLLLECAVRSTLIAAAAAAVLYVMRVKTAQARHAAWAGVVILMLLLPAWTEWGPKTSLRVLAPQPRRVDVTMRSGYSFAISSVQPDANRFEQKAPRPARNLHVLVLGFYLSGLGTLLVRLAIGTARAYADAWVGLPRWQVD